MSRFQDFITEARKKAIPDRETFKYVAQKLLQKNQGLFNSVNSAVNLIPNATGAVVGLIPTPGQSSFKLLSAKGPITQAFGNYNPALYRGINKAMRNTGLDIGVPEGTNVNLPPGLWEVVDARRGGYNSGYGNTIKVKNTQTGEQLRFSHLSKIAKIKAGQKLSGGVRVAQTGRTGNVTGPHLDLEYYDKAGRVSDVLRSQYRGYL